MTDLREVTHETFAPHVGERFTIDLADGRTVELELVAVRVLLEKHLHQRLKRDSFSLYFRGPALYLPQSTYQLRNETFGTMGMFIVPIGRAEDGYEYEAVFT